MIGNQGGIIVRQNDGREWRGRLLTAFNQNASFIEFADEQGEKQVLPLESVECIFFLHERRAAPRQVRRLPNDVIEQVFLKSGANYTVLTNTQQAEINGFFGYPDSTSMAEVQRIFFVSANVLGRKLASPIGELLQETCALSKERIDEAVAEQHKRLGDILVEKGISTREEVEQAVEKFGRKSAKKRLYVGEMLLKAGLITQEQLDFALTEQNKSKGKRIGDILVEKGILEEEAMLSCLAKQLRVPFVDLSTVEPEPDALMALDASLAKELQVLPMALHDHVLEVATSEPNNLDIVNKLQFQTNLHIRLMLAKGSQITDKLKFYYPDELVELEEFAIESGEEEDTESIDVLSSEAEQAPIVRLANRILMDGVEAGASDIHILVREGRVVVEFRINGVLSEFMHFNRSLLNPLVTRFKIIAKMDIAEHRLPQDGRIRMRMPDRDVEFRVSCVPSIGGETLVLRILDKKKKSLSLSKVGLAEEDFRRMQHICQSDHGLVLITGPTGSGKSTTMVSVISDLLGKGKRLISLEDPVETEVPGVLQVQVHAKIGFTFARALRNLLRHDPDIIMVGEIRDGETAEVAIEAALTGHLLISSLHTNTAAGAFDRLVNMGVEAYLVAATVKGVMAQRLLPRMCDQCKQRIDVPDDMRVLLEHAGADSDADYYESRGCQQCRDTGISGRKLVYELIAVNEELSHMIVEGAPEHALKEAAMKNGMRPLANLAIEYAQAGEVMLQHVMPLLVE